MLIATYCNAKALSVVATQWAQSLRKVYDGPSVAFCANIPEQTARAALSAHGIEPVCVSGPEDRQVRLLVELWARYLSAERPAREPVAIYDGADIVFQRSLDALMAELAETGGVRAVLEPRRIEDSPSTSRALLRVIGQHRHRQIWDGLRRRIMLNAGIMAGWACDLARTWQGLLQFQDDLSWANDWCADQAWLNYQAYVRPGSVLPVAQSWAYDLRFWPWELDQDGRYVRPTNGGAEREVVHVVHLGGHGLGNKPYRAEEVAK